MGKEVVLRLFNLGLKSKYLINSSVESCGGGNKLYRMLFEKNGKRVERMLRSDGASNTFGYNILPQTQNGARVLKKTKAVSVTPQRDGSQILNCFDFTKKSGRLKSYYRANESDAWQPHKLFIG